MFFFYHQRSLRKTGMSDVSNELCKQVYDKRMSLSFFLKNMSSSKGRTRSWEITFCKEVFYRDINKVHNWFLPFFSHKQMLKKDSEYFSFFHRVPDLCFLDVLLIICWEICDTDRCTCKIPSLVHMCSIGELI